METTRFSPLPLRGNRSLANRVVVPPMASGTAAADGSVTAATIAHYGRLALSGAGLVMVEYSYVSDSGKSEENQLAASRDEQTPGLTRVAKAIHERGVLAGLQLTHAGGKTTADLSGGRVLAPSAIAVPVKNRQMPVPEAMTLAEVSALKADFLSAVARAVRAGFDLVEFHSAHGYGLNQWLSPLTNHRDDLYGGSLEKNARLLWELVSEVRATFPEVLVAVRLPGQDFIPGGLTTLDTRWVARKLQAAGLDILDVSSGVGGWRRPGAHAGEGYLVEEAALLKAAVSIPVIGVGGIESGGYIDWALSEGKLSLAAVGRAILKDPVEWSRNFKKNNWRASAGLNLSAVSPLLR